MSSLAGNEGAVSYRTWRRTVLHVAPHAAPLNNAAILLGSMVLDSTASSLVIYPNIYRISSAGGRLLE